MGTQKAVCNPGADRAGLGGAASWSLPACTHQPPLPCSSEGSGLLTATSAGSTASGGALGSVPKHSLRLDSGFLSCQLSPGLGTRALTGPLSSASPLSLSRATSLLAHPQHPGERRPPGIGNQAPTAHTPHWVPRRELPPNSCLCITEGTLQIAQRASFLPCFSSPSRTSQLSSGHSHPLMLPDHQAVWVPLGVKILLVATIS